MCLNRICSLCDFLISPFHLDKVSVGDENRLPYTVVSRCRTHWMFWFLSNCNGPLSLEDCRKSQYYLKGLRPKNKVKTMTSVTDWTSIMSHWTCGILCSVGRRLIHQKVCSRLNTPSVTSTWVRREYVLSYLLRLVKSLYRSWSVRSPSRFRSHVLSIDDWQSVRPTKSLRHMLS